MYSDSEDSDDYIHNILKLGELVHVIQGTQIKRRRTKVKVKRLSRSEAKEWKAKKEASGGAGGIDSSGSDGGGTGQVSKFPEEARRLLAAGEKLNGALVVKPAERKTPQGGTKQVTDSEMCSIKMHFKGKNYLVKAPNHIKISTLLDIVVSSLQGDTVGEKFLVIDEHFTLLQMSMTVKEVVTAIRARNQAKEQNAHDFANL